MKNLRWEGGESGESRESGESGNNHWTWCSHWAGQALMASLLKLDVKVQETLLGWQAWFIWISICCFSHSMAEDEYWSLIISIFIFSILSSASFMLYSCSHSFFQSIRSMDTLYVLSNFPIWSCCSSSARVWHEELARVGPSGGAKDPRPRVFVHGKWVLEWVLEWAGSGGGVATSELSVNGVIGEGNWEELEFGYGE